MKFMLMMNTPGNGELLSAQGLAGPDQANLVKAGPDGEPVTDGVFPESKEFLAGFWLVDVETAERAYRIAAEASMAPGPADYTSRLGSVMHVLYLIFSEGYAASSGVELRRVDLSTEALRLARMSRRLLPQEP